MMSGARSFCGATLLSHTRLVTAAHCWRSHDHQGRHFIVVLGTLRLFQGGVRIQTNQVVVHPNYNSFNLNNDIAIIRVNHVHFNAHINRVLLPSGNNQYVGYRATAVGYGLVGANAPGYPYALNYVYLNVISNAECGRYIPPSQLIHSVICTSGVGPRGPCPGDSGGPLVIWGPTLIGVTAFGAGGSGGCQGGRPSGYMRVTSFLPWIRSHL